MSAKPEIVVIGASTGGLAALRKLIAGLPADFPAAVLITLHIGSHNSILPELLSASSKLPVRHGCAHAPIMPGTVLIAPSDHHLIVAPGHVLLSHGPKENFARPAIDPMFRSAAAAYRERAIGVILTGELDDGTVGLQAIKTYGGTCIVQDPAEAEAPSMPRSAAEYVDIDFCLPLDGILETLLELVNQPVSAPQDDRMAGSVPVENHLVSTERSSMDELNQIGRPSGFTCPECTGALWEVEEAAPPRFRCHTGHAYTARYLAHAQEKVAEEAIWAAVRALHEKETLFRQFEKRAREANRIGAADEHAASAERARTHADILRRIATE